VPEKSEITTNTRSPPEIYGMAYLICLFSVAVEEGAGRRAGAGINAG
jgi:hypothetical protein